MIGSEALMPMNKKKQRSLTTWNRSSIFSKMSWRKPKGSFEAPWDILGPTPGYGWNNIAMSRVLYYAGDIEESKAFIDKAANFKELHINSTWGKVQYDRNTMLFQYLYHKRKMKEIKFRDRYYWLDFNALVDLAGHYFKKENAHLLLTSELSANPERFLVLYNIFSSENTIFFDEIWELIKDFNPDYFIQLFGEKLATDQRDGILKYFQYYISKFYLEDDNPNRAIEGFERILNDPTLDSNYERLLIARVQEGLSDAHDMLDNRSEADRYLRDFYRTFPQLLPFSGLKMKLKLEAVGIDEKSNAILSNLENFELEWVEEVGPWPIASISFEEGEEGLSIKYEIRESSDQDTFFSGAFNVNKYEDPAAELVYRLFGIKRELK